MTAAVTHPGRTDAAAPPRRSPLARKVTLADIHAARDAGDKLAMLTCYDFTTAQVMQAAGVPILLVGDTAASVIFGHPSTTAIRQPILQELTAGVRRGAPNAFLMADMPFGSYHGDPGTAVDNVCEMVRATGCDAVKLEVVPRQAKLIRRIADAGVAVCAHLGLRPQSVQLYGYRAQARTAKGTERLVRDARRMQRAGAAMLLLEAVPPEASRAVVEAVDLPVLGCGAGPAPVAHVVVLQDLLGLTSRRPRFVPAIAEGSLRQMVEEYARQVETAAYPAGEHCYGMAQGEAEKLAERRE
jgi:3-methyl-2-oxobutanoate hydroxymethyltransferase